MKPDSLGKRKAFLALLSKKRNAPILHFTDKLDSIEPGILPLVSALESEMTTPIYSCEGHWDKRKEPYVTFVVLPGMNRKFHRFLSSLLESTPIELCEMTIIHRHIPKRFQYGPFIDWKIVIDVPFVRFSTPDDFDVFKRTEIPRYASFMIDSFRRFAFDLELVTGE